MSKHKNRNICVEKTNDSSIVSKASMAHRNYHDDKFVECFIQKLSIRSPLINRGYYIRAKAIQHIFTRFFKETENFASSQIISCGAGFDSSYFNFKSKNLLPSTVNYFEVDFQGVVERKKNIIVSDEKLHKLIDDYVVKDGGIFGASYKLFACDLSNLDSLRVSLEHLGFDFDCPTLMLSECVITYMEEEHSSNLIKWARQMISSCNFITYEQILPNDGFGQVMTAHFKKLNSPIKAINIYKDIQSHKERYRNLGWPKVSALDMNEFHFGILDPEERERINLLEMFDEFEEYHLKCSHYFILSASNANFNISFENYEKHSNIRDSPKFKELSISWMGVEGIQRFGHTSSLLNDENLVTIGGFGNVDRQHKRLKQLHILNLNTLIENKIHIECNEYHLDRLYHQTVLTKNGSSILFGGRRSPSQPVAEIVAIDVRPSLVKDSEQPKISVIGRFDNEFRSRWRHSANLIINPDGTEQVIIFGGITSEHHVLGDFFTFHLSTLQFTQMDIKDDPGARHSHAASVWNEDKIVLTGGLDSQDVALNSVLIFDVKTNRWKEPKIDGLIIPRYSHSSNIHGDKLLLVGGVNVFQDGSPGLTVVDLQLLTSTNYALPFVMLERPLMTYKHSSVIWKNKLILIGGGANCFSFGTHFNSNIMALNLDFVLTSPE